MYWKITLSLLLLCLPLTAKGKALKTSKVQTVVVSPHKITSLHDSDSLLKNISIPNEKYVLENGLTVILSEDHSSPFVAASIWYNVGSLNEQPHRTGFAHLFEHLMFEGSAFVPQDGHFKYLDGVGGFSLNASTSFDRTNYYETVPKNRLELVLALEASRMFFLTIDQARLDEQRAVVRREREQRYETSPYGLATLSLWQKIFPKDNPFHGQVIGSHKDIEAANLGDVTAFYDRYYGPSNATLTLVGDFNKDEVKVLVARYFSTLPKSKIEPAKKIPEIEIKQQEIVRVEERLGRLPLLRMQWITPPLFKAGDADLDIISIILGGGESGRLTKALTRDKQLANNVSVYQQSMEQTSVFTIDALLNPGVKEDDVIAEIDRVIAGLTTNPPQNNEIERGRNLILTNYYFGLQEFGGSSGKAEALQTYNRFAGNPNFMQQDLARYQAVDQKTLADSVSTYLKPQARKVLIATPTYNQVAQKD